MAMTWRASLRFFLSLTLLHLSMNVQAQENSSTKKLTIFSDYLENGFLNWSWGPHEASQMREVREGTSAMSFTPRSFSGLYFKKSGEALQIARFQVLTLSVKISASQAQKMRIALGEAGSTQAQGTIVIVQPGSWQTLTVELSTMSPPIGGSFDKIYIQGGDAQNSGTFFVDSVYLMEAVSAVASNPDPSAIEIPMDAAGSVKARGLTPTKAGLRPLCKTEIRLSLVDVLRLPQPPALDGFHEPTSRTQLFRNGYDVSWDAANLRALARDMSALIDRLDLNKLSQTLHQCQATTDGGCRLRLLQALATHAWRHPLTESERTFVGAAASALGRVGAPPIADGLRETIKVILFDPRFLFRSELGSPHAVSGRTTVPLENWEKLAEISYSLTHRPPSMELIQDLPAFDEEPDGFRSLSWKMSRSPQFAQVLNDFVSQWLVFHGLEAQTLADVPEWSPDLAREMSSELLQFVTEVIQGDGTLRALLTQASPHSHQKGPGLFGSRAFLTASGKNGKASMIQRGVRIIRNALCQNLPQPPPTLDTSPPDDLDPIDPLYDTKLTLHHTSQAACKGCHGRIDPAGLAFQSFDGLGRDRGQEVDFEGLGIIPRITVSIGSQKEDLDTGNLQRLTQSLAQSEMLRQCFARNALRSLVGRELDARELALADNFAQTYLSIEAHEEGKIADFFAAVLQRDDFHIRTIVPVH